VCRLRDPLQLGGAPLDVDRGEIVFELAKLFGTMMTVRTAYDDHIVLLVGFAAGSSSAEPAFAQASVQFTNTTDSTDYSNVIGAPIRVDTTPDLAAGVCNSLYSQISAMNFGSTANNEARQTLPDVARANVQAIIAAATFSVS
jgi:hypothetical protein